MSSHEKVVVTANFQILDGVIEPSYPFSLFPGISYPLGYPIGIRA